MDDESWSPGVPPWQNGNLQLSIFTATTPATAQIAQLLRWKKKNLNDLMYNL